MVNDMLQMLSAYHGASREALLKLLRLLGAHRFTVHNMRSTLAQLQSSEVTAGRAGGKASQMADTLTLELLELLCDVVGSAPEGPCSSLTACLCSQKPATCPGLARLRPPS